MTRVLYTYPARWLDHDPAPFEFKDPALAEHPEAKALLALLNRSQQFEAEAWRVLVADAKRIEDLTSDRDALRAQVRSLQEELAWADEIEAAAEREAREWQAAA